ncbi:MAG TPA: DNA polymerase III subunit beta [Armatimonadota bacterium]|jgi:DNA polymerase-3 subunit beta
MRAICARKDLYHGVQTVSRAIAGRSAWPILNNVLIRTENGQLRLTAFDLELGMECSVPASVETSGSLTVPAKLLTEVLATLPEADVQISVDEQNAVNVRCEKSDYTVLGLPADEFRPLPEVPDTHSFQIAQSALHDMVRQTIFAVSPDESRAILTGILMILNGAQIKFVATDTYRLAVRNSTVGNAAGEATCIVPRRALDEVSRLLDDESKDPVTISIADSQIKFLVNGVTIVSRLIEGQFPNYERVIPAEYQKKLTVPTDEFLSKVRRASIVARENANRVMLRTEDDRLTLTAQSGDVGKAYEELEVVKEGDDLEIAFNAKYLTEFLSVVGTEGIFLEHAGGASAGLMKPIGKEDYLYVLMPMQIM